MPTYEYLCASCNQKFETEQAMSDEPLSSCPLCNEGPVKRLIGGGAGLIFKGSGFYKNDSKKSPACSAAGSCPSGGSCASGGAD